MTTTKRPRRNSDGNLGRALKSLELRVHVLEARVLPPLEREKKSVVATTTGDVRKPIKGNFMKVAEDQIVQLTSEIRKLRQAIERNQQALMNGRDAARYVGYSHPVFNALVKAGVIPQTKLDDDLQARYARVILDRIIEEATAAGRGER